MQPEVTLTIYDERGNVQQVVVRSKRFTIGRSLDNDLVIDDAGLSRRHALIETFDGMVQVSDCGSQNGTYINRQPVTGVALLKDGDVILIGDACDIRVRISNLNSASAEAMPETNQRFGNGNRLEENTGRPFHSARRDWFSAPKIAVASVATILLAAGLLIYFSSRPARQPDPIEPGNISNQPSPPTPGPAPPIERTLDNQIGEAVKQLMRQISSDPQPYFLPEKAHEAVKRKVAQYSSSASLAAALRTVKQRDAKIIEQARRENIEPGLVIYTALAESNGGQTRTDVIEIASQAFPKLLGIKTLIGTEQAETSLIVVAAYKIGPAVRKTHPLIRIRERLITNVSTQNNVWYLHEKNGITEQVYDFVLSFLAIGVIAQNPHQFNVDADPLTF